MKATNILIIILALRFSFCHLNILKQKRDECQQTYYFSYRHHSQTLSIYSSLIFSNNLKKLGNGSFGQVYEVEVGDQLIAMKMIIVDYSKEEQRIQKEKDMILNEIKLLNYFFGQKGMPQIYGCEKVDSNIYIIAMQHLDCSLEKESCLENFHKLNLLQRLNKYSELVNLIKLFHNHQIIHRDIKPQNIMFNFINEMNPEPTHSENKNNQDLSDNENDLYLIDFGIGQYDQLALQEDHYDQKHLTQGNQAQTQNTKEINLIQTNNLLSGTLEYLSPQARHFKTNTKDDDIYALILTLIYIETKIELGFNIQNIYKSFQNFKSINFKQIYQAQVKEYLLDVEIDYQQQNLNTLKKINENLIEQNSNDRNKQIQFFSDLIELLQLYYQNNSCCDGNIIVKLQSIINKFIIQTKNLDNQKKLNQGKINGWTQYFIIKTFLQKESKRSTQNKKRSQEYINSQIFKIELKEISKTLWRRREEQLNQLMQQTFKQKHFNDYNINIEQKRKINQEQIQNYNPEKYKKENEYDLFIKFEEVIDLESQKIKEKVNQEELQNENNFYYQEENYQDDQEETYSNIPNQQKKKKINYQGKSEKDFEDKGNQYIKKEKIHNLNKIVNRQNYHNETQQNQTNSTENGSTYIKQIQSVNQLISNKLLVLPILKKQFINDVVYRYNNKTKDLERLQLNKRLENFEKAIY